MSADLPRAISKEYYSFVHAFIQSSLEADKMLGKFYTDYDVARTMIKALCQQLPSEPIHHRLSIIDPFCGDGRLVVILLEELANYAAYQSVHLFISLWDVDGIAVKSACDAVRNTCVEKNFSFEIDARMEDAFVGYAAMTEHYDICVTNPPWSLLKPQKLFAKSNGERAMAAYREAIEKYDAYMRLEFSNSQPANKFGKWGTNLARCGVEVALRIVCPGGISGIVSPASLLNDQVSGNLRKWIFDHFCMTDISFYPAEMQLYGSADVSSVTVVAKSGEQTQSIHVRVYGEKDKYEERLVDGEMLQYVKRHNYSLPFNTGLASIPIMMSLERLPTTEEYCCDNALKFTREMDETRFMDRIADQGEITFVKGFMVDRYAFETAGYYLREGSTRIPSSVNSYKIAWRDVSRDSQIRRMKATILPPKHICGNSLGVIYPVTTNDEALKLLVAVMNSLIFEFQARSMLVSNHVSAGIVKQIHVPQFIPHTGIAELVDRQIAGEDVEVEIEVAVAKLYGLPEKEYQGIVAAYGIPQETKNEILRRYLERAGGEGTTR